MIENTDAEQIERLNSRIAELLREREMLVEQCAHAAFEAYGSITSDQYIMEGPAGLAKRMINAIKALGDKS